MSPQLESLERAIAEVERAGEEYAKRARQESALQAGRHGVKQEAIKRLMAPAWRESDGGKAAVEDPPRASSVSAAEKLVETDEGYAEHLLAERETTFEKNMAYTRLLTSRLRALSTLVDAIRQTPNVVGALLSDELTLDLIRAKDDQREQTVGGVPR